MRQNRATRGGGTVVSAKAFVVLSTNASVLLNFASLTGGGMHLDNARARCNGESVIRDNSATNGGGGASLSGSSEMTLYERSIFFNCSTSGSGGAAHISDASTITLLGSSLVINCSASTSGGGFYASGASKIMLNETSRLEYNAAAGDGGGAFLTGGSAMAVGESAVVTQNTADAAGGGLALDELPLEVIHVADLESVHAALVLHRRPGLNLVVAEVAVGAGERHEDDLSEERDLGH